MSSSAQVNPQNIELCPMQVVYDGVDLGGTEGGVTVSMKPKLSPIKVDQLGDTEIDSVVSSQEYSVKMILAESRLKSIWKVAFPFNKLVDDGSGHQSMYFDSQIGAHLSSFAKQLKLHPLSKDVSDLSGDWLFYKAVAKSATEVKYGPDKQVGLQVEFMIQPDMSVNPSRYCFHGDPSIGLVNASAAAAVAGGSNVGDGTISSITVGSLTKTETITATCVGVPAANKSNWEVHGSISGPLGIVQISSGSAGASAVFASTPAGVIGFTITDGSTDFAVGDTFTIATTGANYT